MRLTGKHGEDIETGVHFAKDIETDVLEGDEPCQG
jgi:hypothetical protein